MVTETDFVQNCSVDNVVEKISTYRKRLQDYAFIKSDDGF
jgi:uncharacterized protein YlzI (FlbEa/FlbD family)